MRTSWVYGPHGKNFLKSIIKLASTRERLDVVGDQTGAPTSSLSIVEAMLALVRSWDKAKQAETGIYHFSNAGHTTWHGFACEIINQYKHLNLSPILKVDVDSIAAITTAAYPTAAARPENSVLDNTKLNSVFNITLPHWQLGLQQVMRDGERSN